MFSAKGVTTDQRKLMKAALGDLSYVCGNTMLQGHVLHTMLCTKDGLH